MNAHRARSGRSPAQVGRAALLVLMIALTPAVAAARQDDTDGSGAPADRLVGPDDGSWTLRLEPMAWYASPSGKIRLPGGSTSKVAVEDMNLDSPRISPAGEGHLRAGKWRFGLAAADYAIDGETLSSTGFAIGDVSVSPGDVYETDFDLTTFAIDVRYEAWRKDFAEDSSGDPVPVVLSVEVLGGVRLYDFDFSIRSGSSSSGTDQFYAVPIVGARFEAELAEDFTIDLVLAGGWFGDSQRSATALDVIVGFTWRPHPNVGLQVGWQQFAWFFEDDDDRGNFEYDGMMAGVYGGLSIRF